MAENSQRFSGEIGEEYDLLQEAVPWHDKFQDTIVERLADLTIGSGDGLTLLEAGFGTGLTTKRACLRFPGASIVAIDSVAFMEEKTKARLGPVLSRKVRFVIGDLLTALRTLPDNLFDGFYSGYVLHNIVASARREIMMEIHMVLKVGAPYINGDRIALDDPKEQEMALASAIDSCGIFLHKHHNPAYYLEWVRHYLRDEEPDLIFRSSDQKKILESAGFHSVLYVFQKGLEAVCIATK